MKKKVTIPDTEKKLAIVKRYLHILALLQSNKDPENWNGSSLADILSKDEKNTDISSKSVGDYIRNNLRDELGLDIDVEKGARRIELEGDISNEMLKKIINVYASFVTTDSSREMVLGNLIKRHPEDCLWLLARIYFAIKQKKRIKFDYKPNPKNSYKNLVNPFHLVIRNHNLYLVCRIGGNGKIMPLIVNKISDLKVTDDHFDEEIPSLDEVFADTLGSFICGKRKNVKLRFKKKLQSTIEEVLGYIEYELEEVDEDTCEVRFSLVDDAYLCKQLLLYGRDVEIVEPRELRETMVTMLRESLGVYED